MLFVYIEDHQGYSTDYVLIQSDQPVETVQLETLSWSMVGAGRVSTPARDLIKLANAEGITLTEIERRENQHATMPVEWKDYPIVKGATGNY